MHRTRTRLAARAHRVATAIERRGVVATYRLHDRVLANRRSRRLFAQRRPQLDDVQRAVLEGYIAGDDEAAAAVCGRHVPLDVQLDHDLVASQTVRGDPAVEDPAHLESLVDGAHRFFVEERRQGLAHQLAALCPDQALERGVGVQNFFTAERRHPQGDLLESTAEQCDVERDRG